MPVRRGAPSSLQLAPLPAAREGRLAAPSGEARRPRRPSTPRKVRGKEGSYNRGNRAKIQKVFLHLRCLPCRPLQPRRDQESVSGIVAPRPPRRRRRPRRTCPYPRHRKGNRFVKCKMSWWRSWREELKGTISNAHRSGRRCNWGRRPRRRCPLRAGRAVPKFRPFRRGGSEAADAVLSASSAAAAATSALQLRAAEPAAEEEENTHPDSDLGNACKNILQKMLSDDK